VYFEEGLKTELTSISGLTNKVFPLSANEGVTTPYVVYISSEGEYEKALGGGYLVGTKEVNCELHILHGSYASLKDLTRQVITKLISFQGRVIGGVGGVKVYDVKYDVIHEQYIDELFQYLCVISVTVKI
jgi:hypothetical protein